MDWLTDPQIWIAFVTLFALEVVLGIDNIIFISILAGKLPPDEQPRARTLGLGLALGTRILLLLSLAWLAKLTEPLISISRYALSGRDLVLLIGGLFLIAKSTFEIHDKLESQEGHRSAGVRASFTAVLIQIAILDIVFSLDSVITAVGMVDQVPVMIAAVIASILVMMLFAGAVSGFVERHPTIKILALSFLILIGTSLVAEGLHFHIPKGYVYFAMAFSVGVEMINLRLRGRAAQVVHLRNRVSETDGGAAS
jgi:predicted tellurium resistance membrane protein TerC